MSIAPPTTAHGGVKIYNLSSVGKALPAWVTNKKKLAALSTSAKRRKRAERVCCWQLPRLGGRDGADRL